MTDPTSSIEDETYAFVGPKDDGWYRTQIPDWIALHPDLRDGSYRLFVIIRSIIMEKRRKVRLLTLDQLAFLMVGKNGKPVGASTIKELLANLDAIGLVRNPDRTRLVTSTGNKGIQSRRRYQISDWPEDRETYFGWRNTWDKLDAYTTDWRATRSDVYAGQITGQKTGHRDEQTDQDSKQPSEAPETTSPSPAETKETAGHLNGRKTGHGGRKTGHGGRKTARHADATSDDANTLKEFPQGVSSSSSGDTDTAPVSGGSEEEDAPSVRKTPSVAQTVMNRTGSTVEEAQAVIESIEDHAERNSIEIGSLGRYIVGFDDADLRRHLRKIRAQRAAQARAEVSQSAAPDARCETHDEALPCGGCKGAPRPVLVRLLKHYGPGRRPDLKELFSTRPDLKNLVGTT